MNNDDILTPRARRELRKFFPTAYWAIGGLCFYWATVIITGLLRPEQELELPIIGKCGSGEAIIFTLTFLWPVLLIGHLLVYGYQRVAAKGSLSGQFPGVLGDQEIPKSLRLLRVGLFVIFIVWPTVVYATLAVRSFTHMWIVLKVGDQVHIRQDAPMIKNAEGRMVGNYVRYQKWDLLGSLKLPNEFPKGKRPDWRWLHWRDEDPKDEKTTIELKLSDTTGKAVALAVTDPKTDDGKQPTPIKPKHWPTALPVVQPWWNVVSMLGFCGSVILLSVNAFRRRKS